MLIHHHCSTRARRSRTAKSGFCGQISASGSDSGPISPPLHLVKGASLRVQQQPGVWRRSLAATGLLTRWYAAENSNVTSVKWIQLRFQCLPQLGRPRGNIQRRNSYEDSLLVALMHALDKSAICLALPNLINSCEQKLLCLGNCMQCLHTSG